jgi:exonuclease III
MHGVMKTLMYNIIIGMFILSIASINVNGLRNNLKRNVIFEFLCRNKFSLIFLQETHSEENDEPVWSKEWQGKMHFSHGNRQSRGLLFSLQKNLVSALIIFLGIRKGDG